VSFPAILAGREAGAASGAMRALLREPAFAGAALTAALVVVQGLWLAAAYPAAYLDADLLSYLAYYRDWRQGEVAAFGYTVPKVLPVLLLGPLGTPERAFAASLAVAAIGGSVLFVLASATFGRLVGVLAAALYVLDPMRAVLTLRSSVDLYTGVALLGAMLALRRKAVLAAGTLVLVAALGKPVAAVCGLAVLLVRGEPWRRRLVAAALPCLALVASAWLDAVLEGRPFLAAFSLPDQHERFVAVAQAPARSWDGFLDLVVRDWFGRLLFAHTWPLVLIGAGLYAFAALRGRLGDDDRRAWLLLVPGLLAAGYVGLAAVHPYVVFTRFFWLPSLVLSVLAGYAIVEIARRMPGAGAVGAVLAVALGFTLLLDRAADHRWRERIMLAPFETHAALADRAISSIADEERCPGEAIVPLAYLPLAAWRAPGKLQRGELCAVEDWADGRGCARPECVLYMPAAPTTARARVALSRWVAGATRTEVVDEHGALYRSQHG
jgi:hypothetical protein